MFAEGEVSFENGMVISCKTAYPYDFTVTYYVVKGGKVLAIRRPDWSEAFTIRINGKPAEGLMKKGYVYLEGLKDGDEIQVILDSNVKHIYASSKVAENSGCVALQKGPLVYCAEGVDNEQDVLSLFLKEGGIISQSKQPVPELKGAVKLEAEGYRIEDKGALYSMQKPEKKECTITMIPYYTWGNRGLNQMRVWLPER